MQKIDGDLLRQYAEEGHTLQEAADHFGVNYNSMGNWCRKHGVTFRGNWQRPKTEIERTPAPPKPISAKQRDLEHQVAVNRQHVRRLDYQLKQLLSQITKEIDGGPENEM